MNSNYSHQPELVIDLKALAWKIIDQWKIVLIVAIVCSLLLCGMKYTSDTRDYDNQIAEQKENAEQSKLPVNERIDKIMETLPEGERETVKYIVREQEWVDAQKAYVQDSILMETDPTNQHVLKMVYLIDSDDEDAKSALMSNYAVFLQSDNAIETIKPFIAPDADNRYISELFYDTGKDISESRTIKQNDFLLINMIIPEGVDASAISDCIKKLLKSHCDSMQKEHAHRLELVSEDIVHVFHEDNVQNRTNIFYSVNNLEVHIRNSQGTLTDSQKAAIDSISAIKKEVSERTNIDADEEEVNNSIPAPTLSKTYACLGLYLVYSSISVYT